MKRRATIPGTDSFISFSIRFITLNTASPSSEPCRSGSDRLDDRAAAVADYKKALALGGSRPLPELFAAAGIQFDFGEQLIASLMETIRNELDKLSL